MTQTQRIPLRLVVFVMVMIASSTGALRAEEAADTVRLATTTSVSSSGLLELLQPAFELTTGYHLEVESVPTGRALRLGRFGKVDVLLVHAPEAEEEFVKAGWGVSRHLAMTNDFVIVGPKNDPAGIRGLSDAASALTAIAKRQALFVSRADDSGTHSKERSLWSAAAIDPAGNWYFEAGESMRDALATASRLQAYTLVDLGTWLAQRTHVNLQIMVAGDPRFNNPYGVIEVNAGRHRGINARGAQAFVSWLLGEQGQALIRALRVDGEQLYVPAVDMENIQVQPAVSTPLSVTPDTVDGR
jgi:tungstate transport system substrate-binding protein